MTNMLKPLPPLQRELWEPHVPGESMALPNPYRCVWCLRDVPKPKPCEVLWSFDWALVECECGNYLPLTAAEFEAWPEVGNATEVHAS